KAGHVYVISNIGSFGDNVYKIGMTRRLEPMERVKELGDASVPFSFDVHAMIYSENAPALENELHKKFDFQRLNLINTRKEFFAVTLDEIKNE
ncbi:GIY-YIG nuclease family protein, partial [Vibrio cholerae]